MQDNNNIYIPHRKKEEKPPKFFVIRNILNLIFMLGAIIGCILYFYSSHRIGTIVILVSIVFKLVESSLRLLK